MMPTAPGVTPGVLPAAPTAGWPDPAVPGGASVAAACAGLGDLRVCQLELCERLAEGTDGRLAELLLGDRDQRAQDLDRRPRLRQVGDLLALGTEAQPDPRRVGERGHGLDHEVPDGRPAQVVDERRGELLRRGLRVDVADVLVVLVGAHAGAPVVGWLKISCADSRVRTTTCSWTARTSPASASSSARWRIAPLPCSSMSATRSIHGVRPSGPWCARVHSSSSAMAARAARGRPACEVDQLGVEAVALRTPQVLLDVCIAGAPRHGRPSSICARDSAIRAMISAAIASVSPSSVWPSQMRTSMVPKA